MADTVPTLSETLSALEASWAAAFPEATPEHVQAAAKQLQQDCYEETPPECGPLYAQTEFYAAVALIQEISDGVAEAVRDGLVERGCPLLEEPGPQVLQSTKLVAPNTGGGLAILRDALRAEGQTVAIQVPRGCPGHVAVWISIPACLRREGQRPPPSIEGRVTVTYADPPAA